MDNFPLDPLNSLDPLERRIASLEGKITELSNQNMQLKNNLPQKSKCATPLGIVFGGALSLGLAVLACSESNEKTIDNTALRGFIVFFFLGLIFCPTFAMLFNTMLNKKLYSMEERISQNQKLINELEISICDDKRLRARNMKITNRNLQQSSENDLHGNSVDSPD